MPAPRPPQVRTKLFPLAKPAATGDAAGGGATGGVASGALPPSSKSLQAAMYAAKAKSRTVKVAGLGAVHEDSGLQEGGVVLQEKGKVYAETMSLADVTTDTNSYYILQLIHETAK